jgi:hypothetical protein
VALVDSGSSHTFMNYKFAIAANCHLRTTSARKIAVAGGGHLTSTATVPHLSYNIQDHSFTSTFQVLPLETYDYILGLNWRYAVSPITLDLPLRLVTVHQKGSPIVLTDHTTPPATCIISLEDLNKLLSKPVLGYLIQIHALQSTNSTSTTPLSPDLEQLVQSFAPVISEPTEAEIVTTPSHYNLGPSLQT